MAKTDFKTINEYHSNFSGETLERMETIRSIVKKAAPDAEEVISYQIPCFKYHGYLVYYSAYKSHISLSSPWSPALLKEFKTELAKYNVSKSAIQFPNDEPLPTTLIKKIVQFRMKENKENESVKKKKAKA
jgi:uncharacterized protein YdhG (YjbR/CyaY superfamily)